MKNKGSLILLLLLLLISIIGNAYLYSNSKKSKDALLSKTNEINVLNLEKDSLLNELDKVNEELKIVWSENELGTEKIDELDIIKNKQQKRINSLLRQLANVRNTGDMESLKSELALLKQEKDILAQTDKSNGEKIAQLNSLNNKLKDSEKALTDENNKIASTLLKAQKPNYNELLISPIRIKKGREELASKAKHVSFLRLKLKMFSNPVTTEGVLVPLKIRILSPDGAVLTKDTKKITDKSKINTVSEVIMFSGTEKQMKWDYKHLADLEKGVYKYELITDDELIQVGSFVLN